MNEKNEIQEQENTAVDILPKDIDAAIGQAIKQRDALDMLFNRLLQPGVDYDVIPHTPKPTLLKPGADILCKVFGLVPGKPEIVSSKEDFENGIFSYLVANPLYHDGKLVAYGLGSANSYEKKYRYRKIKGQMVENPDPGDLQNTLVKMADKRAYVAATLKATGASRKFTQDMEDLEGKDTGSKPVKRKSSGYEKTLYKISDAQAKRMFALADGNGDIVRTVLGAYGYEHSRDVKKNEYEKICDEIETAVAEKVEPEKQEKSEESSAGAGEDIPLCFQDAE